MSSSRRITDDQAELFDVVDRKDNVVGQATRAECHRDKKLIHRSIGILVFNDKGELFLQKRSTTKDLYPGFWALSVGGHLTSGESYEAAAKKEMREELGIAVPLESLGKFFHEDEIEAEMFMIFKTVHNGPFTLNPEEIEKGEFFDLKDLSVKVKSGEVKLTPKAEYALRVCKLLD